MLMDKLISRKEVLKTLGVHPNTINNMVKRGDLVAIKLGNKKLYNLDKYIREKGLIRQNIIKKKICYCRVSSAKQKEDLIRQIKYMKDRFPLYEIISDIGSGINFNRKGIKQIIEYAIKGEIEEVVIAYKDRLARIGYDIIEFLIKQYSNGKILIINKSEEETPIEELTKDIMTIMNVYVAKINGLRRYKKEIKEYIKNPK